MTCTIGTASIRGKMSKDTAFGSLPRQAYSDSLLERAATLRGEVEQALMSDVHGLRASIQLLPSDVEAHFDDADGPA